ncbi:helix-turn-helix domain-containing protein [Caballeronia sp. INSB1]|uniref:helix-turn-helix domain-containing protein n=1 Tax=Caballeronia sp. INSB1 TaxID=2921751 RepID=UPI002032293C|nr:helix-turn-helix domain-containing protein [Caballeronia sp. INSB1]
MKKKNAREQKPTSAEETKAKFTDNTAEGQRQRLLDALKKGPVTTIEARRDLDIMMPAARVFELPRDTSCKAWVIWRS